MVVDLPGFVRAGFGAAGAIKPREWPEQTKQPSAEPGETALHAGPSIDPPDVLYDNLKRYYGKHAPGTKSDADLRLLAQRVSTTTTARINAPMKKKCKRRRGRAEGRRKRGGAHFSLRSGAWPG